jgi:hypothetical protein
MSEDFLYFIWQNRLLLSPSLSLTDGTPIDILDPGVRNSGSGPDFSNARIRMDGITWSGNVEIHVRSSDWYRHHHGNDDSYDNIILHAVQEHDKQINRKNGQPIPTLVMAGCYPEHYLSNHRWLIRFSGRELPCKSGLMQLPVLLKTSWLDRLSAERLEERMQSISAVHTSCGERWPETLYILLARGFGFSTNAVPFELLARCTPYDLLIRQRQFSEEMEAILFGQSGLLPLHSEEAYPVRLRKSYRQFQQRYGLNGISPHLWKFGGLRPVNFPTIRIAQFAMLHATHEHLCDRIIQAIEPVEAAGLLDVSTSDYWHHHFRFGMQGMNTRKNLGISSIHTLLINAIIPFLFFLGKKRQLPVLCDKALYWLESLPPENNRIIRHWEESGLYAANASQSQALLSLKKKYCDERCCASCGIGQHLIRQPPAHQGNEMEQSRKEQMT